MRAAVPWFRHNTISHLVRPLGFEPRTCGLRGGYKVSELVVKVSEYVPFLQLVEVLWRWQWDSPGLGRTFSDTIVG